VRFLHNAFAGAFYLGEVELDAIRAVREALRDFARVTADRAGDTGIRQIRTSRRFAFYLDADGDPVVAAYSDLGALGFSALIFLVLGVRACRFLRDPASHTPARRVRSWGEKHSLMAHFRDGIAEVAASQQEVQERMAFRAQRASGARFAGPHAPGAKTGFQHARTAPSGDAILGLHVAAQQICEQETMEVMAGTRRFKIALPPRITDGTRLRLRTRPPEEEICT
jgi:hypothetical protein